jgi:3-oxoacyl-[acyl-carrier-protein] synthase II
MVHGTGTLLNDKTEALAINDVFAEAQQSKLWVSGIKSMTGHTSGASGLVGVVTAIDCLRTGAVPPTLGLVEPIPEAQGLRLHTTPAASADLRFAQVNAFGFGGVNAVVILERVQS